MPTNANVLKFYTATVLVKSRVLYQSANYIIFFFLKWFLDQSRSEYLKDKNSGYLGSVFFYRGLTSHPLSILTFFADIGKHIGISDSLSSTYLD